MRCFFYFIIAFMLCFSVYAQDDVNRFVNYYCTTHAVTTAEQTIVFTREAFDLSVIVDSSSAEVPWITFITRDKFNISYTRDVLTTETGDKSVPLFVGTPFNAAYGKITGIKYKCDNTTAKIHVFYWCELGEGDE